MPRRLTDRAAREANAAAQRRHRERMTQAERQEESRRQAERYRRRAAARTDAERKAASERHRLRWAALTDAERKAAAEKQRQRRAAFTDAERKADNERQRLRRAKRAKRKAEAGGELQQQRCKELDHEEGEAAVKWHLQGEPLSIIDQEDIEDELGRLLTLSEVEQCPPLIVMDPPVATGETQGGENAEPKETDQMNDSGGKGKMTSLKEVLKPGDKFTKPGRKIKPCSAAHRSCTPSPPPSPVGSPPPPAGPSRSFSWDSLMRRPTFEAAPVECFKHAPLNQSWRNVCAGLKAEVAQRGAGRGAAATYWVATLLQVQGYRGLFRPEGLGSDSSQDRWLEICSPDVKPVGWCAARGLPLTPPPAAGPAADWQKRLVSLLTGSRTLPPSFYRKVMASLSRGSQLSEGQTLEVVDKSCISQVRAARVTRQVGRRLHVHYLDAPEEDGGFWCHENSPLVHPVGWALAVGHRIEAPADYLARCESGEFLPTDATEDYLPAPPPVTHEGFKVGMKLEALDPLNLGSIGVATVRQILGNHFMMVRLETSPDSDWFCYHAASPYIFPAGFCRTVGIPLTSPYGYGYGEMQNERFFWEVYLRSEGATAAPAHLFHRPPLSHGFQSGHRLEAVDLMDPQLVCVATVAAVVGRLLRIHFDGWEEQFDQWADAESPDLFPVGWCSLVGYPLEPPRPPERPAPKKVPKRRPTGRRGRPRVRGAGGRPQRAAARRGESESNGQGGAQDRESELESVTGDGESVAESGHGADDAARLSPPPTPESETRLEFTPTPTSELRSELSSAPTPEPRAGSLPEPTPEPASEPRPETNPGGSPGAPPGAIPRATPRATPEPTPEATSEPAPEPQAKPPSETQPMEVCEQKAPETGVGSDTPGAQGTQGTVGETPGVPTDPAPSPDIPMES